MIKIFFRKRKIGLLFCRSCSKPYFVIFDRKNDITACLGGRRTDLFKIRLSDMESIASPILMTSDGIHDYLSVDQMEDIIGEHGLTERACEEMISGARIQGSCDDISIVIGAIRERP